MVANMKPNPCGRRPGEEAGHLPAGASRRFAASCALTTLTGGMTCARRLAGAPQPASSAPSRSPASPRGRSRPEPRPGRSRARLSRLLPVLALLLGALSPFAAAPAAPPTCW